MTSQMVRLQCLHASQICHKDTAKSDVSFRTEISLRKRGIQIQSKTITITTMRKK